MFKNTPGKGQFHPPLELKKAKTYLITTDMRRRKVYKNDVHTLKKIVLI